MNKKIIVIVLMLLMITTKSYAYSSGFLYMINAMSVERVNVNGLSVNEYVYEKYNLIVYGSPKNVTYNQRFKKTVDGNWDGKGKEWSGTGERGEWWILGQDYNGLPVHNEIFPDDYTSGTSPLYWNYRVVKNAEESWNDTSMFQYEMQKEYMLNSKLSRFGVTYDITAAQIGLDKARVENYATWGNAGSIYTEKPGEGNIYWAATFSVPPLAKDAKLVSILNLKNGYEYTIGENQDSIQIPINFGALIQTNSEYAKEEHIKVIESELKINSETVDILSDTKKAKIENEYILTVSKEDFVNGKTLYINLECNSLMATFFANDPAMYATQNATITVNLNVAEYTKVKVENDKEGPKIYNVQIKRVTTENGKEALTDLDVSKSTKEQFVCAGQVIKIRVTTEATASNVTFDFTGYSSIKKLDELTKNFEWIEPNSRGGKGRFSSLRELEKMYQFPQNMTLVRADANKKIYEATYIIPYEATQTLHSWNSLREKSDNAFNINENALFSRKDTCYKLVIKAKSMSNVTTKRVDFDVAERWDLLYNRDISKYVK